MTRQGALAESGTLVLDANTFWQLEAPVVRERLMRSMRAADLVFRPTALNLLEIVSTPEPTRRHRLLAVLREMAAGSGVRPMPDEVLRLTGKMIADGKRQFDWAPSNLEWMLYEPERIEEKHVLAAQKHLVQAQQQFDVMHRSGRKNVRAFLKAKKVKNPWGDIPTFLEKQWTTASHLDTYIERKWKTLALTGVPKIEAVMENEAWRLYFEGLGASVYERALLGQSPSPVGVVDIRQLVYLAGASRRVLVTDDEDLVRVGRAVLGRRYAGSRVLRFREFAAASA